MQSDIYILIPMSVFCGFFMRPLHMFFVNKGFKLVKYIDSKQFAIIMVFVSLLTGIAITMSSIYLTLKIAGFIPLGESVEIFVASFLVGAALWVFYARKFNVVCRIDSD